MQGPLRNRGHRLVRSCLSSLDHDPDPRGQSCRASAIERIDVVHRAAASRSLRNIKPQINFARYHHGCSEINIVYRGDRAHIERRNMKNLKIIQRYIFLGGIDWFLETTSFILNYEHSVISSFPFFSFRSYSFSALSRKICVLSVCASVSGVIRFPVSFFLFFFLVEKIPPLCIEPPCHEPCFQWIFHSRRLWMKNTGGATSNVTGSVKGQLY